MRIEFIRCLHQAEPAVLQQVLARHAETAEAAGERRHQRIVCGNDAVARRDVAVLSPAQAERMLLRARQQQRAPRLFCPRPHAQDALAPAKKQSSVRLGLMQM